MNPKWLGGDFPSSVSAKSAHLTRLITIRITRQASRYPLVGAAEQRRWHFEAKRLRRLKVDEQFESRRAFRGQLGHFCANQNLARHSPHMAKKILDLWPKAEQPARSCNFGE